MTMTTSEKNKLLSKEAKLKELCMMTNAELDLLAHSKLNRDRGMRLTIIHSYLRKITHLILSIEDLTK